MTCALPRAPGAKPHFADSDVALYVGDAAELLRSFEDGAFESAITSPPYLDARPDYPSADVEMLGAVFAELRRVCSRSLIVNVGRLWRRHCELLWWTDVVEAAREAGWPHRDTHVWIKPNANPHQGEVLTNAHEYILLFGDGFDEDAVRTPYSSETVLRYGRRFVNHSGVKGDGRGASDAFKQRELNPKGARGKSFFVCITGGEKGNPHPAPMPLLLAEHLVRLSGAERIVDPFAGSGTTLLAARRLGRCAVGLEIVEEYAEIAALRLAQQQLRV